jgi:AbrB family looped-hinge helix DNA binding protein
METDMVNKTYSVEEIFEDDPENPDNVLMKIPDEIAEQMGWKPGDVLKVVTEEGSISIKKVDNG